MRFLSGAVSLSQIIGGVLGVGTIPWPRLIRSETSGSNGGVISLAAGLASAVSLNLGTVTAGDRILLYGSVKFTGAGAGGVFTWSPVKTAGTATVTYNGGNAAFQVDLAGNLSSGTIQPAVSGIVLVTGTGTLTLDLEVASTNLGSVQTGDARFLAIVMAGS